MKNKYFKTLVLLITFLLTISISATGQVRKFKSTSYSYMYKINEYRWSDWSESTESSVLITLDLNNERITIYSATKQVYDIAEYEGETTDDDGDDFFSFFCVNNEGLTCRVRLAKLNSQGGRNQFYIDFSDMRWVYNVYTLD
jgi:hypothetical protein